ncbi:MAG: DUF1549 domain-containing protein [Gemmataceae bacterium]|nr:DUF1549 domain-containing protein [Gemmataceae bacterium]
MLTFLLLGAAPPLPPSFVRDVAPLLRAHCVKCHAGPKPRGGLDVTRPGSIGRALVPGDAAQSPLFALVRDRKMPPGKPLGEQEAETLRRWIAAGARWEGPALGGAEPWWSLQALEAAPPPQAEGAANPIDAFLLAELAKKRLGFAPSADRRTLLRRLSVDLAGLPPTPEEIDAFLKDERPDAWERQADRLLASPAYGERWGRHWLDVARFAESHGYEMNTLRPNAWPYRDWVIRAFNADLPFAGFVREQVAGGPDPASTGFLVAGPHDLVGNGTEEGKRQQRADDLHDMVSTTSGVFLGLTAGCARCHDHKFDPITQKDYHALKALFAGVEHADVDLPSAEPGTRPAVTPLTNVERFAPVKLKHLRFTVRATNDGAEPCLDELEAYGSGPGNLALASRGVKPSASSEYPATIHRIIHLNDGKHGNARSWISRERGKGWAMLSFPAVETIERVEWGRDREGAYSDRLPVEYSIEASLDGKAWKEVASGKGRAKRGAGRKVYAGRFRAPDETRLLARGDVMQPKETIPPGGLSALSPLRIDPKAGDAARRRAMAEWIAGQPLAARVMANRAWHWHFGQGIVDTPSDFGRMGGKPTHPDLLDWLAARLRETGSLKGLHRLVVASRAYRQSSRSDAGRAVDAGNRLLWRWTPRRMEAEAIRDSVLRAAGTLDRRMGGEGYHLWDYSGYVIVFKPKARPGPETWRRMVYQFKPRLQQDGAFGAFDCPDATASAPRRGSSTTALQALNLLNDPFVIEQAGRLAARAGKEKDAVGRMFALAFGREPDAEERAGAAALAGKHGLGALARALLNANEFVWVD